MGVRVFTGIIFLLSLVLTSDAEALGKLYFTDIQKCWNKKNPVTEEKRENAINTFNKIYALATANDVENDTLDFLDLLKFYGCEKKQFEKIVEKSRPFITQSQKNELEYMKVLAKEVSSYRSPEPELARARVLAKKVATPFDKIYDEEEQAELIANGRKAAAARKSTCSTIDNRTPILGKKRDQRDMGWCYAFTAADLLSHKTGKFISAADLAVSYYNANPFVANIVHGNKKFSELEGGHINKALRRGMKAGMCLESDVPSSDFSFDLDFYNANGYKYATSSLERFRSEYLRLKRAYGKDVAHKSITQCFKDQQNGISQLFPNVPVEDIIAALESNKSRRMIRELADQSCKERIKLEQKYEIHDYSATQLGLNGKIISELLDETLAKGTIAGISYDSEYLFTRNRFPVPEGADHGSSIVARKFNEKTNSCEYLIRNSWGGNCSNIPYHSTYACENGDVWVPEEVINQSVDSVTYLE